MDGRCLRTFAWTFALAFACPAAPLGAEERDVLPLPDRVVANARLAEARGGRLELPQANGNAATGTVSGNTLNSGTTGFNAVVQGSFDGVRGIATVIQNTGNQVVIQNSVILNLQIRQ